MGAQVFHTNKFQFVGSCLNIVNNVVQLLQARAGRARSALRHEALRPAACDRRRGTNSMAAAADMEPTYARCSCRRRGKHARPRDSRVMPTARTNTRMPIASRLAVEPQRGCVDAMMFQVCARA